MSYVFADNGGLFTVSAIGQAQTKQRVIVDASGYWIVRLDGTEVRPIINQFPAGTAISPLPAHLIVR